MEMRYPRTGEPIVPRLLRPLMLDRHATPTFPADPESELIAYDELGPDAWHRLPHETCRRVSLFVVDRVQTRLRALPDTVLDTQLPPPAAVLALSLERRTINTLRRAGTFASNDPPWTIRRYLKIARFGGRALVDLLAALEVHAGIPPMPPASAELGGRRMSDKLLLSIARRLPAMETDLEIDPVREGSSIWPLDFRQLIKTAARLGHDIPFHVIDLGGVRVVVRHGQLTAARATHRVAVRTVQTLGAATTDAIASQIRATVDPTVDAVFVERLLSGLPAFRWLDRGTGWFWFVQRSNRLIADLRKVLSVVTRVPVTRLAFALFRMRAGPRPSPAAVQGLCTAVPEARVRNGIVMVDRPLDRRAHLNEGETRVVKVLESAHGSLSDGQLRGRVREIGLAWTPVWRLLRSSPLFEQTPEGQFRLLGTG
jgi:hypothetical protein